MVGSGGGVEMMSHLVFEGSGVYEPVICPKTVLWKRVPCGEEDPLFGVFVGTPENASKFAQVVVVRDNRIVNQLMQEEN
jgi:hypothetical protein